MIIIIGEMILFTIPFVIYYFYKYGFLVKMKKAWIIIPEIIVISVLILSNVAILMDSKSIVNGGQICDEPISYVSRKPSKFRIALIGTADGAEYWAIGDPDMFGRGTLVNNEKVNLYVLPHTKLIYKIDYQIGDICINAYSIYSLNEYLLLLIVFEVGLLLFVAYVVLKELIGDTDRLGTCR